MEEGEDKGELRDFSYLSCYILFFLPSTKKAKLHFFIFFRKTFSFFHKAASLSALRVTQKGQARIALSRFSEREHTRYNFRTAFRNEFLFTVSRYY